MSQTAKDWLLALYLTIARLVIALIVGGIIGRMPPYEELAVNTVVWYGIFRVAIFIYRALRNNRAKAQVPPVYQPPAAPVYQAPAAPAAPAYQATAAAALPAGTELKLPLKDFAPGIAPGAVIFPGGMKAVVTAVSADSLTAMIIQAG